jgi:hypothetical protein
MYVNITDTYISTLLVHMKAFMHEYPGLEFAYEGVSKSFRTGARTANGTALCH